MRKLNAEFNKETESQINKLLTFVEVSVLRNTATVCSCEETSSIVCGRLPSIISMTSRALRMDILFLHPRLQRRIHIMLHGLPTRLRLKERHDG